MKREREDDMIFQALIDIGRNLHEKLSSLDEHIRRAQLECLQSFFQKQQEAVKDCLDGIDDQLIKLSVYVEEYQRLQASLEELNEKRIPELGGTPLPMPEPISGDTLADILTGRVDYLKSRGKI